MILLVISPGMLGIITIPTEQFSVQILCAFSPNNVVPFGVRTIIVKAWCSVRVSLYVFASFHDPYIRAHKEVSHETLVSPAGRDRF